MKNIGNAVITLLLLIATSSLHANTKSVQVNATGYGANQEEAIRAALTSAVSQVNGVSLSSREVTASSSISASATDKAGLTESAEIELKSRVAASTQTKGQVKRYDILALEHNEDGTYKAELSVEVYRYDVPASSNRKRIVILPPKAKNSYFLFGRVQGHQISDYVYTELEKAIVQTRKFAVLSRVDLADMHAELNLIASDSTSPEEKAKLGRMLGADYVLIPRITKAEGRTSTRTIQVTGQTETSHTGEVRVALKVVVPATGEIKFSDEYSATTSKPLGIGLFKYAVAKAAHDLVDRIYPLLIVDVSGRQVIINGGGDAVKVGQHYNVYNKGKQIVDPYTGESLGSKRSFVGKIKIISVESKMSTATIISGTDFNTGMVLAKDKTPVKKSSYRKPPTPKADTGIKLPFD